MRKWIITIILLFSICLVSCKNSRNDDINQSLNSLDKVSNLEYYTNFESKDNKIHWYARFDEVEGANNYIIKVNTEKFDSKNNVVDITKYIMAGRTCTVSVRSVKQIDEDNAIKADPVSISFKGYKTPDGLIFNQLDNNTYSVDATKCSWQAITGELLLPDYYNNNKITVLAKNSFARQTMLGNGASGGNYVTTKVVLPKYLEIIDEFALNVCSKLKEVVFGEYVREIGYSAFRNDFELESITFPESVVKIDRLAISNCDALKEVILGNKIEYIGESAFYGDTLLENINLPESITYIGRDAFKRTKWLEDKEDGFIYVNDICIDYKGDLPSVVSAKMIKEGTKVISCSFTNSKTIESFEIPNSVIRVSDNMFSYSSLKEIRFEDGCQLEELPTQMFLNCLNLKSIHIPQSIKNIGFNCFSGLNIEVTFEKVPEILNGFSHMTFEKFVVLDGVKEIGVNCFTNCKNLKEIVICEGVEVINELAFSGCSKLEKVTLPNSLNEIKNQAFSYCSSLESIKLPDNLKIIGTYGLNDTGLDCDSKTGAFFGCGIKYIVIPEVDVLGWYSFTDKLEVIVLPKSIKNLCYNSIRQNVKIYYQGNSEEYNNQKWIFVNEKLYRPYQNVYYYSENKPSNDGLYWHYVDGIATEW